MDSAATPDPGATPERPEPPSVRHPGPDPEPTARPAPRPGQDAAPGPLPAVPRQPEAERAERLRALEDRIAALERKRRATHAAWLARMLLFAFLHWPSD